MQCLMRLSPFFNLNDLSTGSFPLYEFASIYSKFSLLTWYPVDHEEFWNWNLSVTWSFVSYDYVLCLDKLGSHPV